MSYSFLRFFSAALFLFVLIGVAPDSAAQGQVTYIRNGGITSDATHNPEDDVKVISPESAWFNRYTDYPGGYSVCYPTDMSVDVSLSAVCTVFSNGQTRVEIYYDNFAGSLSNAREYISYGNRFTENTLDHTVQTDRTVYTNGRPVHLLKWTRRKLAKVPNDKNYYASAEIVKNSNEVYTIIIKSTQPIENEMQFIDSFTFAPQQGTAGIYLSAKPSASTMNRETADFFQKYFSPDSRLTFGVFEPSAPEVMRSLTALEQTLAYSFPFLVRYQSLDEGLPAYGLSEAYANGKCVELTLQTFLQQTSVVNPLSADIPAQANSRIIYRILDGQYDHYFAEYAQKLKAFGHPVLFRLNNEMNGDWCWYSAYYTGKDTLLYTALWRYLHQVFAENGVDNVIWVWNPHDLNRPNFKWNHYLMYYPGDEYVDVVGLTGYNTGTYFPGEKWRTFDEIYRPLYQEYSAIFNKPFMIAEFASNSVGGNKAAWINDMFKQIGAYPGIKAAIWWSGIDYDKDDRPGRIYIMDEDEPVMQAFRANLRNYGTRPGK